ncbi:hypothetical protein [Stieleria sp.]|uniref:Uncharacterized protein n=1 Tax=Stieleria magnilauensis TaxID=2527963 RepID=A0ABX5XIA9_9BACT|nr:hypothetical protein TBK1r_06430 [Planctomycetes bacterium TBK1r]
MPEKAAYQSPSRSYVKAESRRDAVRRMIRPDPLLASLYVDGENKDGKEGWVNAIRDQSGAVYRLLFYIDKLQVAPEFSDLEMYEVLYGAVTEHQELNYPRALFTTTGAINLMRDGIPGRQFVQAVKRGILQIVPYTLGRDIKTAHLRENGYAYLCIYDRDGQGIRVLNLLDYLMVYDHRAGEEIQVHQEEELVIGDTRFVRPFLLKYAQGTKAEVLDTASVAERTLRSKGAF